MDGEHIAITDELDEPVPLSIVVEIEIAAFDRFAISVFHPCQFARVR